MKVYVSRLPTNILTKSSLTFPWPPDKFPSPNLLIFSDKTGYILLYLTIPGVFTTVIHNISTSELIMWLNITSPIISWYIVHENQQWSTKFNYTRVTRQLLIKINWRKQNSPTLPLILQKSSQTFPRLLQQKKFPGFSRTGFPYQVITM